MLVSMPRLGSPSRVSVADYEFVAGIVLRYNVMNPVHHATSASGAEPRTSDDQCGHPSTLGASSYVALLFWIWTIRHLAPLGCNGSRGNIKNDNNPFGSTRTKVHCYSSPNGQSRLSENTECSNENPSSAGFSRLEWCELSLSLLIALGGISCAFIQVCRESSPMRGKKLRLCYDSK